jgi:hypothetical protein
MMTMPEFARKVLLFAPVLLMTFAATESGRARVRMMNEKTNSK